MDLIQLKLLSALKYQHSQQALSDLLQRENELRSELDRMRTLLQKTKAQEPEDAQLRAVGGDIIWLKWVGQVQQELNVSLAGVLAQKEALMAKHRRATGRKIVAEDLAEHQDVARRNIRNKVRLQSAIESALFKKID